MGTTLTPGIISFGLWTIAALAADKGSVSGVVTDAITKRPLDGVKVTLVFDELDFSAVTVRDGSYTLHGLPVGQASFTVSKSGYMEINPLNAGESTGVALASDTSSVTRNFTLSEACRISGRTRERDTDRPLPGVTVTALKEDYGYGARRFIQATSSTVVSNAEGEFEIADLLPGSYILEIGRSILKVLPGKGSSDDVVPPAVFGVSYFPDSGDAAGALPISLAAGERRRLDIDLQKRQLPWITGDIDVIGDAVGRIEVMLSTHTAGSFRVAARGQITDPGSFHIDGMGEGSYIVTAEAVNSAGTKVFAAANVVLAGRQPQQVHLTMRAALSLQGSVRFGDETAALPSGLSVQFRAVDIAPINKPASVSTDGRFRAEGIFPGDYYPRLLGLPPGFAVTGLHYGGLPVALDSPLYAGGAQLDETVVFAITNKVAGISGVLRTPAGDAVPGARVVLVPEVLPERADVNALRLATTKPNGSFVFLNLPPGRYKAFPLSADQRKSDRDVTLLRRLASSSDVVEVSPSQNVSVQLEYR